MPVLSLRGRKARRNREHVETFSSALLWSGSIRMTLYYMPGWIMEAVVGEHFNWCMNMQLCLIPGPEINQVDVRGAILNLHHLHSRILWLFVTFGSLFFFTLAAVVKGRNRAPAALWFTSTSSRRHGPSVASADDSRGEQSCKCLGLGPCVSLQAALQKWIINTSGFFVLFFLSRFGDIRAFNPLLLALNRMPQCCTHTWTVLIYYSTKREEKCDPVCSWIFTFWHKGRYLELVCFSSLSHISLSHRWSFCLNLDNIKSLEATDRALFFWLLFFAVECCILLGF